MARVAANSYGSGDKYAGVNSEGRNEFVRDDGSRYTVGDGVFTSPSGKESEISDDGRTTTTLHSRDDRQDGNVYQGGSLVGNDGSGITPAWSREFSTTYGSGAVNYGGSKGGGGGGVSMQVKALEQAMGRNRDALEDAYDASRGELESSIGAAQKQAYINSQRAMKNLPQAMAASGYNGGVTETTAASIANEYQNALNELVLAKAQEMARLQANLANGIADSDSQYEIQIANALAQAEQLAYQQQMDQADLELRRKAAALDEEKYRTGLLKDKAGTGSKGPSASDITKLIGAGVLTPEQGAALLGYDYAGGQNANVATSYYDALRLAKQQGSSAPLMAYYRSKGMSNAQIAEMLNASASDPESAIYGYRQ